VGFIILNSYNSATTKITYSPVSEISVQEVFPSEASVKTAFKVSKELDKLNDIMMADAENDSNISLVSTIVDLRQENATLQSQLKLLQDVSKIGNLSKFESMYLDDNKLRVYDAIILRSILMHFINYLNNDESINLAFKMISDLNNKIKDAGIDPTDAKYIISINEISTFEIPKDLEIEVNDTK
jgi:hypothetical protein